MAVQWRGLNLPPWWKSRRFCTACNSDTLTPRRGKYPWIANKAETPYVCRLYVHTEGETERVLPHTVLAYCSVDDTKEGMSHFFLSALSRTLFKPCWIPFGLVYRVVQLLSSPVLICAKEEIIASAACQHVIKEDKGATTTLYKSEIVKETKTATSNQVSLCHLK